MDPITKMAILPEVLQEDTCNVALYQKLHDIGLACVNGEVWLKRNLGYSEFSIARDMCSRSYPSEKVEAIRVEAHFTYDRKTGKCQLEGYNCSKTDAEGRYRSHRFLEDFNLLEALNLFSGRAVFKPGAPGEGTGGGWLQLNFDLLADSWRYKVMTFPDFRLDQELARLPLERHLFQFTTSNEPTEESLRRGDVVELCFVQEQGGFRNGEQVSFYKPKDMEAGEVVYGKLMRSAPSRNFPEGEAVVEEPCGRVHHMSLSKIERPPEKIFLQANPRLGAVDIFDANWKPVEALHLQQKYPPRAPDMELPLIDGNRIYCAIIGTPLEPWIPFEEIEERITVCLPGELSGFLDGTLDTVYKFKWIDFSNGKYLLELTDLPSNPIVISDQLQEQVSRLPIMQDQARKLEAPVIPLEDTAHLAPHSSMNPDVAPGPKMEEHRAGDLPEFKRAAVHR
ncbi:hypothetical protein V9K67_21515 [Paraflavisolibacter sp. H34]|uniref:hypothetical protein n=1 Tax=Huijunlia imazamoxiresistens TaxID=3127457 RepID=UPI003019BD3A